MVSCMSDIRNDVAITKFDVIIDKMAVLVWGLLLLFIVNQQDPPGV